MGAEDTKVPNMSGRSNSIHALFFGDIDDGDVPLKGISPTKAATVNGSINSNNEEAVNPIALNPKTPVSRSSSSGRG